MTDPDKWWLPYPPAYGLNSWQLDGRNGADNPGFSLVVGSPWSGKTTMVRSMAELLADDGGWEGYCPECLALWDDHAAGQHDSPVDACRLCR